MVLHNITWTIWSNFLFAQIMVYVIWRNCKSYLSRNKLKFFLRFKKIRTFIDFIEFYEKFLFVVSNVRYSTHHFFSYRHEKGTSHTLNSHGLPLQDTRTMRWSHLGKSCIISLPSPQQREMLNSRGKCMTKAKLAEKQAMNLETFTIVITDARWSREQEPYGERERSL